MDLCSLLFVIFFFYLFYQFCEFSAQIYCIPSRQDEFIWLRDYFLDFDGQSADVENWEVFRKEWKRRSYHATFRILMPLKLEHNGAPEVDEMFTEISFGDHRWAISGKN